MSDFKINSIATKQGQHGPVIAGVSTVNSTGCMKIPSGPTEFRGGRGRGIFAGGQFDTSITLGNTMDFVEIATTGNATDFGDLTDRKNYATNGDRIINSWNIAGGYFPNAILI